MATYFHSNNSEIQGGGGGGSGGDGLQTLVLMNPGYIQYSDTPPPPPPHAAAGNLVFLNSAAAGNTSLATQSFPHVPLQSHGQQFVGIPLSAAAVEQHDVSGLHGLAACGQYSLWNTIDHNSAARDATRATQGLSLSLPAMSGDDVRISGGSSSSASGVTTTNGGTGGGVSGIQSFLLSSKYLKATQELLEEVVNVTNSNGNGVIKTEQHHGKRSFDKVKVVGESSGAASREDSAGGGGAGEGSGKGGSEISATERQEIQMKKAKLLSMLDEVEQRYRQYHNQMQIVISNFEQVAGVGSGKTYTALALQTISKQFRCLKDAITGQIRAANKSLGEEDQYCFGGSGGSRLKYVDHHLRQQRAIQQLGMMHHHHNAWRPQRGLPERSVSVLRAWLFEHFLHPYPKDSDKHMLAKQTGLTRSQVSNWFINARVRLWKPMVEEMYLEEMKDHEINNNNNNNGATTSEENNKSSNKSSEDLKGPNPETETKSLEASRNFHSTQSGFSFMGSSELLDGITQGSSPKKPRNHEIVVPSISNIDVKSNNASNNEHIIKFGGGGSDDDERHGKDEYSFMGNQTNFISGFGQYPIEEIGGRFDSQNFTPRFSGNNNNGVSLTLGLPHCDTLSGTHHQTFLPNQNIANEFGALNTPNPHHSSAAFESINNIQNPKRFVAQLLPDFVA